ncbi:MAG TPA: hypothetical protein V6C58_23765, partial [Allocoleopsis sp.]
MGMKCIRCGTDNDLSDRTTNNGRCKNCHHHFAFEPSTVTDPKFKFTDPFFAKVIDDLSVNNTLFFTPKQFLYFLDKRLKSRSLVSSFGWIFFYIFFNIWSSLFFGNILAAVFGKSSFIIVWFLLNIAFIITFLLGSNSQTANYKARQANAKNLQILGGFILIIGIFLSMIVQSFIVFVITVLLGMSSIYLGTRQRMFIINNISETFLVTQYQFQDWLNRWQEINDNIPKILPSPREEIAAHPINSDITAYSFDRAVICDNSAIAQMLIANNFHFENNCAVLSITGYPQSIFSTVMEMLKRNPDLKVYALHDASPDGVSLVHQLRNNSQWFADSNVIIYDLGLLPKQILSSRGLFIQSSNESAQQAKQLPSEVRASLSIEEQKWLDDGKFVELESFTPARIIKILNQGIAKSQDSSNTDSLLLIDNSGY